MNKLYIVVTPDSVFYHSPQRYADNDNYWSNTAIASKMKIFMRELFDIDKAIEENKYREFDCAKRYGSGSIEFTFDDPSEDHIRQLSSIIHLIVQSLNSGYNQSVKGFTYANLQRHCSEPNFAEFIYNLIDKFVNGYGYELNEFGKHLKIILDHIKSENVLEAEGHNSYPELIATQHAVNQYCKYYHDSVTRKNGYRKGIIMRSFSKIIESRGVCNDTLCEAVEKLFPNDVTEEFKKTFIIGTLNQDG
jgi:hypothetical protein